MQLTPDDKTHLLRAVEVIATAGAEADLAAFPFMLISPKGSAILFYAHYYLATEQEQWAALALQLLEASIAEAGNSLRATSLADGYAGLGWLMQHLVAIGFLEEADAADLADIDLLIDQSLEADFEQGNCDLLYGLVGKGIYLLSRPLTAPIRRSLTRIVAMLAELAVPMAEQQLAWHNVLEEANAATGDIYTLGLPHGSAGILLLLAKIQRLRVATGQTERLLEQGSRWLCQQASHTAELNVFAAHAGQAGFCRLAWCQGDLGIAYALGQVQQVQPLPEIAALLPRLEQSIFGRTLATSGISASPDFTQVDTTLCHGISGALLLLDRIAAASHLPAAPVQQTLRQWLDLLLAQLQGARTAGRSATGVETEAWRNQRVGYEWVEDYGLLQGSFGVGLCLLELAFPGRAGWDALFMTEKRCASE